MPAAEFAAALTSLKLAFDMTKAMKDIRDATVFQGEVFKLQRVIMEAQDSAIRAREAHSAQIDRVRELEAEVAGLKARDADKHRYELKNIAPGALAYMLKPEARGGEAPHWFCQACYDQGKKSLLQKSPMSKPIYACTACKTVVQAQGAPTWLDG